MRFMVFPRSNPFVMGRIHFARSRFYIGRLGTLLCVVSHKLERNLVTFQFAAGFWSVCPR